MTIGCHINLQHSLVPISWTLAVFFGHRAAIILKLLCWVVCLFVLICSPKNSHKFVNIQSPLTLCYYELPLLSLRVSGVRENQYFFDRYLKVENGSNENSAVLFVGLVKTLYDYCSEEIALLLMKRMNVTCVRKLVKRFFSNVTC